MIFRKPDKARYDAVRRLLERAFAPSISEACLVAALLEHGKIRFDFILEQDGKVLAYICYTAAYDAGRRLIGYHLAPLAVLPGQQRRGLGRKIIRESLASIGTSLPVYVLGDPAYYFKTGFRPDRTQKCSFDPEGGHFLVLSSAALPPREVFYEEEFLDLT